MLAIGLASCSSCARPVIIRDMKPLTLGYSPCPNDTYIFHALAHRRIPMRGLEFDIRHEDVESLNRLTLEGVMDVSKVSFGVLPKLLACYCLLRTGAALGRGCGPLVVAREACELKSLAGKRIAVPGYRTTAFLLLRLFDPGFNDNAVAMRYDAVMQAVRDGKADAGLIIHESRFTYPSYGLVEVEDLGAWWERTTGLPIPLGGIVAKRNLGEETVLAIESLIRDSLLYSRAHTDEAMPYIRSHAQELDGKVISEHIGLYVNDFSLGLGPEGEEAVRVLVEMARRKGLLAGPERPLFWE